MKKKVDRIETFIDVTDFGERFNYVTGFMTAFNVFEDGSPWSIDAREYFFDSLQKNVLKPDGKIYFQLTNGKITDEVWDFLKAKADWAHDRSRFVLISNIEG